jgi:hypothetical protein
MTCGICARRDTDVAGDYQRMWESARDTLATGMVNVDPPPVDGGTRWGVSLILQPAEEIATALLAEVMRLRAYLGSNHIFYGADNLHTTVRTIEGYRDQVPADDASIATYVELAQQLGQRFLPFTIDYCGLTANAGSILAQGWPHDANIQTFRRAMHESLAERGLVRPGPELRGPRRAAHATLLLFSGPIDRPEALVRYVEASRDKHVGTSTVDALQVVRYRRTEDSFTTEALAVIQRSS